MAWVDISMGVLGSCPRTVSPTRAVCRGLCVEGGMGGCSWRLAAGGQGSGPAFPCVCRML